MEIDLCVHRGDTNMKKTPLFITFYILTFPLHVSFGSPHSFLFQPTVAKQKSCFAGILLVTTVMSILPLDLSRSGWPQAA